MTVSKILWHTPWRLSNPIPRSYVDDLLSTWVDDAADAMRYAIDKDMLDSLIRPCMRY